MNLLASGLIEPERFLASDDLFAVVSDKFRVSPGHALIIPRRALARFQELNTVEKSRLLEWVVWTQHLLLTTLLPAPEAFNLAVNDGKVAGQTMPQFHFHVSFHAITGMSLIRGAACGGSFQRRRSIGDAQLCGLPW